MGIHGLTSEEGLNSHGLMVDILNHLAPLNRNLVSDEFEESLRYLNKYISLKIHRYKTGTPCWTWKIPPKWRIKDGYIKLSGKEIISIKQHPLHVMSYSTPIQGAIKGSELSKHIHTHPMLPEAIPYEFSFYKPHWGFCLTQTQKNTIREKETYEVCIDSEFIDDYLSVGEHTVSGRSNEHIFFLSHIDHPCQVNDGIIGAAVNMMLAKSLAGQKPYYNYTFLFVPETIGSIAYLSQNEHLIAKIRYAVFVEMVGLENPLVLQRSKKEDALINAYALYAMQKRQEGSRGYQFLTVAANDEKIFDGPGIRIPSISITRVGQNERLKRQRENNPNKSSLGLPYPEYHSHLDNLDLVNYQNVEESLSCLQDLVGILEKDFIPVRKFKGPIFLSKYDLWIDWRTEPGVNEKISRLMYLMEGEMSAFQIAQELNFDLEKLFVFLDKLYEKELIEKKKIPIDFDR